VRAARAIYRADEIPGRRDPFTRRPFMAVYDIDPARPHPFRLRRPDHLFRSALSGILAWNDRCASRRALGRLSNHELSDIGLHRGDFEALFGRR
jgi:uncharacterized protein YjiS (DUF1127 family)